MTTIPQAADLDLAASLETEAAYDPLAFIEGEDTEDWLEQDTSVLLPKPLPPQEAERPTRVSVYSPEHAGSAMNAVRELVTTNAARRHILLSIVDWARDGIASDELFERIEGESAHNRSVYEPMSYCKMLERAGALIMETPKTPATENPPAPEAEAVGNEGVSYLTIEGEVEPLWRSTPEGLEAYEELTQGTEWRQIVLGSEAVYAEVYLAVMDALLDGGKPKSELTDLAETFEVTKNPRRYGAHFIDVLEATQAIRWTDSCWNLTELGKSLLPDLEAYCAA